MAVSGSVSTDDYQGRYLKLSWTATQSTSTNKSTITWTLKGAGSASSSYYYTGNFYVKIAGTVVYEKDSDYRIKLYNGTEVASGKVTVSHASDGSKDFSVSIKAGIYTYARNVSGSKTFTLTQIPRAATISSAPDFNDEDNPILSYSNPAGSAVTTLQACIADSSGNIIVDYRNISKSGTSYTFSFTDVERKALRAKCNTSNSMDVRFYVKTIIGGETYKKYSTKKLSIINANPIFTSDQLNYKDTNTTITAITNKPSMIVQNKSNLQATCTEAIFQKEATLSKYEFWLSNNTQNVKSINTAGSVDFGTINSSSNLTLYAKVTDSRENSVIISKTVTCYQYYTPSFVSFKTYRTNEHGDADLNGTHIKCEYTTNIASVDGKNTRTVNIIGIGSSPIAASGNSKLINLNGDTTSTYKVYAVVTDVFGGTNNSITNTIFGDSRIVNISPDGTGIAFGKKADKINLIDSRWPVQALGFKSSRDGRTLTDINLAAEEERNACLEYYITKSTATGNPGDDGHIIHCHWDNTGGWDAQLFLHDLDGELQTRGCNSGTWGSWRKSLDSVNYTNYVDVKGYAAPKPVTLYSSNGDYGSILLSQSAADFSYLEIFFSENTAVGDTNSKIFNSVRVYSPNGKVVNATIEYTNSTASTLYIKTAYYLISGTSITKKQSSHTVLKTDSVTVYKDGDSSTLTPSTFIRIYKVLGYK